MKSGIFKGKNKKVEEYYFEYCNKKKLMLLLKHLEINIKNRNEGGSR